MDWIGIYFLCITAGCFLFLLAVLFMSSLLRLIAWTKQRNCELLFILIAATGMAVIGSIVPEALGLGTNTVNDFLSGELVAADAALIVVAKFVATLLCLGFGLFGGVFSPAVFMGAGIGSLFGILATTLGYPEFAMTLDGSLRYRSGYEFRGWSSHGNRDYSFGIYEKLRVRADIINRCGNVVFHFYAYIWLFLL